MNILIIKFVYKNLFRFPIRTILTVLGMTVAILSFGLLSTVVDAWYAGAENASNARLIVRSSTSLIFPLPATYLQRIKQVPGVKKVSWARWFGGVYKEPKNFFPQFAIDPQSYLDVYPEYIVSEEEREIFFGDKRSALIGRKIAEEHDLAMGDIFQLTGQIFPGQWDFIVAGIYDGATKGTDTAQMFFHWSYLNEEIGKRSESRGSEMVGVYIVEVDSRDLTSSVSIAIDELFSNSSKETYTETEKAFQLGFVAMTEAIVVAVRLVSYVVILIIMAVLANTMAMTSRDRVREYATIRAIGFQPSFIINLIIFESMMLALIGGFIGVLATFPAAIFFRSATGTLFPVFEISIETVILQVGFAVLTGVSATIIPAIKAASINITEGLRSF